MIINQTFRPPDHPETDETRSDLITIIAVIREPFLAPALQACSPCRKSTGWLHPRPHPAITRIPAINDLWNSVNIFRDKNSKKTQLKALFARLCCRISDISIHCMFSFKVKFLSTQLTAQWTGPANLHLISASYYPCYYAGFMSTRKYFEPWKYFELLATTSQPGLLSY